MAGAIVPHAERALARVLGTLPDARRTGRGWSARCPGHSDRRPSLSIALGRDDRVLLTCRAGCRTDDVLAALGLRWSDLFSGETVRPAPRATYPPLVAARIEVLQRARRQAWARDGALDLYAAADALKLADRVRARVVDTDEAHELLEQCAALTREAEALWALALETA